MVQFQTLRNESFQRVRLYCDVKICSLFDVVAENFQEEIFRAKSDASKDRGPLIYGRGEYFGNSPFPSRIQNFFKVCMVNYGRGMFSADGFLNSHISL